MGEKIARGEGAAVAGGVGPAGIGGGVWHAASNMHVSAVVSAHRWSKERIMGWILLEALVALLVAVAIVWWTMGARKKAPPEKRDANDGDV